MEVRAVAKYVRVQPRKVRLVAAEIKGSPAAMSAHKLQYHPSKGALMLRKVLVSAIANAMENHKVPLENLRVARISVDEGPRLKRITQRAQGRANRIHKKTSHITVVLEDYAGEQEVKAHGTKAKPRPKFEAPKKVAKKVETKVEEVVEEVTEAPATEVTAETAEETKD
jgi:large subunit ribosomal protein L22